MIGFEINEEYELLRKKSMNLTITAICALIVGVIFFLFTFNFFVIIVGVILAIVLFVVADNAFKVYKAKIVQIFEKDILAKHFSKYEFFYNRGIDESALAKTELLQMGNRFYSNDLLVGEYNNVSFLRSDVHIQNVTTNGKNTTTVTYFKGQWYEFDFFKNFDVYLQIRDKEDKLFKRNSRPAKFFSKRPSTKRIKLDHPEFNDIYDVYTSDEQQAFYILTPHFMDKLISFNTNNRGEIVLGFMDNRLYISIYNNTDKFHISRTKPFDYEEFAQLESDALFIKEIVDDLKLDLDIFK